MPSDSKSPISALARGILFSGVARHADKSFENLVSTLADDTKDSLEMQQMKRDFRWMQESNTAYSEICGQFATKWFVGSADGVPKVHLPELWVGKAEIEQIDARGEEDRRGYGEDDVIYLGKTHGQMIRYPDANDADFRKAANVLAFMIGEIAKEREVP
jgi:hypothetical protein